MDIFDGHHTHNRTMTMNPYIEMSQALIFCDFLDSMRSPHTTQQRRNKTMNYYEYVPSQITDPREAHKMLNDFEDMPLEMLQEEMGLEDLPDEEYRKALLDELKEIRDQLVEQSEREWLYNTHYAGMR
jgi:hypothetical protein